MNEVRRSNRSPVNRIQSILEDSRWVECVQSVYNRPLIANMRCGLWYVPPNLRASECYFKSTDGHTRQWKFSLKRLNLHILSLIEQNNGAVIVDSTRRGKLMPDALSKTVPIWCAVINCALGFQNTVYLPKTVSPSERDQISDRIDGWALELKTLLKDNIPRLKRPLRPIWVTPESMLPLEPFGSEDIVEGFYSVVLCTASRRAQDGEQPMAGYTYVQGAADDHELWCPSGFTPEMLWADPELQEISDELIARMESAVKSNKSDVNDIKMACHGIYIAHGSQSTANVNLSDLPAGKKGARLLGNRLDEICKAYEQHSGDFIILSSPQTDFAECVALMLNCRYNSGKVPELYVSKEVVTQRNALIIQNTGVIPSRTTQNVVSSFLRN